MFLILVLVVKPAQFQILLGIQYTILPSDNVSLIEQIIHPDQKLSTNNFLHAGSHRKQTQAARKQSDGAHLLHG